MEVEVGLRLLNVGDFRRIFEFSLPKSDYSITVEPHKHFKLRFGCGYENGSMRSNWGTIVSLFDPPGGVVFLLPSIPPSSLSRFTNHFIFSSDLGSLRLSLHRFSRSGD